MFTVTSRAHPATPPEGVPEFLKRGGGALEAGGGER